MNYYNDNDQFSVKWIKALIEAGLIPPGEVDDRSINDIRPSDLDGFTNVTFSQALAAGLTHSGWLVGPTTDPSGQEAAHASHLVSPER
jgi:hypothetical protein